MVKDGYQFYKDGYKILRNFECSYGKYIDNEQILNLDKNSNIKDCVLMIDEMQIFFDSRQSMRKSSIHFSNFIQQIRKRNIIVLCTTQYSNTIDLRLRQHLDIIAYPNFIKYLDVCEVTYFDLTSLENDISIVSGYSDLQVTPMTRKIVYNCIPIFKMYNTEEMII
jgi:hypothetical protein